LDMIRFSKLAAALAVLPVLAVASPVYAGSPGQLAQGSNLYMVKNLTQNGSYAKTISASCNDEVQYSMMLANTGFGALNNVTLSATLPSAGGTSTATATTDLGGTSGTHDSVTVNLGSNQTISYENGSTNLYNDKAGLIKNLSDGVTASGVNIGTINGSTTVFVNFKAKVTCPTPTPEVKLACVELDVKNIDRTHYDFTAKGSVQNATITGYTFTAKDANGKVVDTYNNTTSSTTSGIYLFNQESGTYTVSAQLNTDHGNNSNANCVKQITVATPPTTPPTTPPSTPPAKTLPNTGAGDVLGIFGASSAFGAAAHFVNSRRNRR
jgi:hypothetical protein